MKVGKLNCRNRPIGKQKPEQILTAEDGYYTPAGAARRARALPNFNPGEHAHQMRIKEWSTR
jgi:hypothetical protein